LTRALLVGLGSIGRRHLDNLRRLEPRMRIAVWRQHSHDPAIPEGADEVLFTPADAVAFAPEIGLLTGPASTHIAAARLLAEAGAALFIEKPLAASLDGVDDLLALCRSRKLPVMVGYNFHFHPAMLDLRDAIADGQIGRLLSIRAEVGQYLPDWRPAADYRRSVSARAELGGGALLELSHELDYVRWIAGEVASVTAHAAKLSDLEMDAEDTAEILLHFTSGAIGSIHVDMIQRTPSRWCRVIGTEGTLTWDGLTGEVRLYHAADAAWSQLFAPNQLDRNHMYLAELQVFLEAARYRSEPPVTGEDGRRVLAITLACKRSALEKRTIEV
jgi:predicted dehydrogenase